MPCMGKEEGAVNPLAHLDADWLGCDPGKTNMATVAHEERFPSGAVKSVWQRSLTAGQYYRQSGITEHAKESKVWTAGIKPQHDLLSQVTNYTASLQRYREYADTTLVTWPAMWAELSKRRWSNARFRLYGGKQRTVAKFWAETVKGAKVRCNSAATGRPLALAYGAAGFSGSGSIGSKGVPVKQMLREACKQFPGRVVLVHEFRTSRVSSARTNVVQGQAESFRWLYPVRSMAKRSRIRGLMCSTSNVIKRRFYDRDVMRALLGSLLLGLAVRGWFTRVRVLPNGQDVFEDIPTVLAVIPNLADRNMYLQLIRGLPPPGRRSQPSEAVEDVLAFYPGLHDRLKAVPRYEHDSNTVDDVGKKLETSFANSLTVLFLRRVEQGVALAGARVIAGSHEHQRRLWLPVGGSPAWTERQRSWVARSVQGKVVTWLEGQGGVVPFEAMRDEVARQRRLLGVGQGLVVDDAWLERGCNRGSLLRHAVDTSRQLEAANVSWQLDWAVWQAAGGQRNTRPYRPPSPFALTPGCTCKAHHIKLDTQALFGLMRTAGMLPADITSLEKFRSGVDGPKDSEVANRWNAFLPNLAAVRPNVGQKFAQVVHTDGVAISVMFIRPKPDESPDKLPCMGKEEGAVNPLAHLDADWLGCDPGKTNMATVAHEEQYPSGAVKSSGITEHAKESKVWTAGIKPQHDLLSQVTNYTASLQRYREYADTTLVTWPAMWAELSKARWFRLYGGKQRTVAKFWAETVKGAKVRCNSAATGRPLALAYGAAGFSGSGSIGSKGVPVKQMLREACKQFPGRVVLVHEFRTSRVSSARTNVVQGQAESFK
ncbi:hypothetical protein QJQ45_014135 [Haematococcus lacustris]|nr:hypothetical protein QJQ45_014135 [Haematococcus lacustris]